MKRSIIIYGVLCALLLLLLQWLDYRWYIKLLSTEVYSGTIALIFTAIGVWGGLQITTLKRKEVPLRENKIYATGKVNLNISAREMDVLRLMARGLSNQEIADSLFISQHTVKSHSTNLYSKLNVRRRTQAVMEARRLQIL